MDPRPFKYIKSKEADILMFYVYRDFKFPTTTIDSCRDYDSLTLIAWSLGAPAACLFCKEHELSPVKSIAVNGTAFPAHNEYGIPKSIFDGTISSLSEDNLRRFYRRMCGSSKSFEAFLENVPCRPLNEIDNELRTLRDMKHSGIEIIQKALICEQDRIIPAENQLNCWQNLSIPSHRIPGSHFPFYSYPSWEALIDA